MEKEKELKEIIKKFGKIIIENKNEKNYNLYKDFNIQLKEPIHKLTFHTDYVFCLIIFK